MAVKSIFSTIYVMLNNQAELLCATETWWLRQALWEMKMNSFSTVEVLYGIVTGHPLDGKVIHPTRYPNNDVFLKLWIGMPISNYIQRKG